MQKSSVQKKFALVFICIPVSPGNSRLIWCFPRNFGLWIDKIVPRWLFHVRQNLVLDSDTYLLHVEVISFIIYKSFVLLICWFDQLCYHKEPLKKNIIQYCYITISNSITDIFQYITFFLLITLLGQL